MSESVEIISSAVERAILLCQKTYSSGLVMPICDLFNLMENLHEPNRIRELKRKLIPLGFNPESPNYGWKSEPSKVLLIQALIEFGCNLIPKEIVPFLHSSCLKLPGEIIEKIFEYVDEKTLLPLVIEDLKCQGFFSNFSKKDRIWQQAFRKSFSFIDDRVKLDQIIDKKFSDTPFNKFLFLTRHKHDLLSPLKEEDGEIFCFRGNVQAPLPEHPNLFGKGIIPYLRGKFTETYQKDIVTFIGEVEHSHSHLKITIWARVSTSEKKVVDIHLNVQKRDDLLDAFICFWGKRDWQRISCGVQGQLYGRTKLFILQDLFKIRSPLDSHIKPLIEHELVTNFASYEKILLKKFS